MSGSPFGLWINPKLLTSGSPFALWTSLILLTSGSPFALWISLILLTSSLFGPEDLMLSALLLYLMLSALLLVFSIPGFDCSSRRHTYQLI